MLRRQLEGLLKISDDAPKDEGGVGGREGGEEEAEGLYVSQFLEVQAGILRNALAEVVS